MRFAVVSAKTWATPASRGHDGPLQVEGSLADKVILQAMEICKLLSIRKH
jgi:hypothetical protein